ncbi:MAG: M14 family zinc carboxypeptidase [Pyrinomonadaceae bacterium]
MKFFLTTFTILLFLLMTNSTDAQSPKNLAEIWDKTHISNKFPSNVRHRDLEKYLETLKGLDIDISEIGQSHDKRPIYQINWGKGAKRVFMWSQMHGDEPTATSALIDMFAFLQKNRNRLKWVKELEENLSIRAIPMLNPDGAEVYKRRNSQGIDINRDARALETPEASLLMKIFQEFKPEIGFNLHNQQELTTVGESTRQASISVLAVRANPETELSEAQHRNTRICALIVEALEQFIKGNIASYDDEYTENAFGDTFSDMGAPVILIETGGLFEKDEMYLTKLNFVAFLTALRSLADGSEASADPRAYEDLQENGGGKLHNFIFRNATVVSFEEQEEEPAEKTAESGIETKPAESLVKPQKTMVFKPYVADVAMNRERRRAEITNPPTFVRQIGTLSGHRGLTEFDVKGYYMIAGNGVVKNGRAGEFLFYKNTRKIDWNAKDLKTKFPPDAIFSRSQWVVGEKLFVK